MNLVDAFGELKNGDLLLWRGKRWFSPVIRWWTKSPWSHVGIYYRNPSAGPSYVDADVGGVKIHPFEFEPPDAFQHTRLPWAQNMPSKVFEPLDTSYSWFDFIRAAVGLPGNNRGYICSEFAAHVLRLGGWQMDDDYNPTPGQLSDAVAKGGFDFRIQELG